MEKTWTGYWRYRSQGTGRSVFDGLSGIEIVKADSEKEAQIAIRDAAQRRKNIPITLLENVVVSRVRSE